MTTPSGGVTADARQRLAAEIKNPRTVQRRWRALSSVTNACAGFFC